MATNKKNAPNIDDSDLVNYPDGRIRDNTGSGDGTPVNRLLYSDLHEFFAKLMRLAAITYSDLPDNETNGYQLVDAAIALAGKNDFIAPIITEGGVIQIVLKLSTLKPGEALICKAGFNFTTETTIKGTESSTKNVVVPSQFKTGDYIRMINGDTEITLVRLADALNINTLVSELSYLKAATEAEEYAGTSLVKATTPYTNQLAFSRRVIGLDSSIFLASTVRNGLMSAADKVLLASLVNPVKNVGWFSGVNIGGSLPTGGAMPVSGDVVSAILVVSTASSSTFLVTVSKPMTGVNYFVRIMMQSEGSIEFDNDVCAPVFKPITSTTFQISITESVPSTQSIKFHLEVVQIS